MFDDADDLRDDDYDPEPVYLDDKPAASVEDDSGDEDLPPLLDIDDGKQDSGNCGMSYTAIPAMKIKSCTPSCSVSKRWGCATKFLM